jgi:hypothetical protein
MIRNLILTFVVSGVMVTSAASNKYHVHIFQDVVVDGKSIKAGDYIIEMQNNTAVMKQGKQTIEVPAHTESVTKKVDSTTLTSTDNKLEEIEIGGSRTKIVFGAAPTTVGGAE